MPKAAFYAVKGSQTGIICATIAWW